MRRIDGSAEVDAQARLHDIAKRPGREGRMDIFGRFMDGQKDAPRLGAGFL